MTEVATAREPSAPVLELRRLSLTLGGFALREVSLRLGRGDYLVLLGPSGCGKTTLLRCIAGHYRAEPAALLMAGAPVGDVPPHRRRVGYVAQAVDLFPHLDVARNIAFGLRYVHLTGEQRQARFDRIVDLLGLRELLRRDPATLSGGESKRVTLARSLVVEPRVLLLDEPLSMLDPNARNAMLAALRLVHEELGTAAIHVTHEREEAWALAGGGAAGRVAVMRGGRIEQAGPVEELFRRPKSRFVAEFLGGANVLPARFEKEGGAWLAVLDWAQLKLAGPVGFGRGWVQIRPESLALVPTAADGVVTGRVLGLSDRGIYRELAVEVAGGRVLRVHLSGAAEVITPGQSIHLRCVTPPHPIPEDADA